MKNLYDPVEIQSLSKEELVDLYNRSAAEVEELQSAQKVIRDELLIKIDSDGEVIGTTQVIKAEKINVTTSVEDAAQFGATLQEVDPEKISLEDAVNLGAVRTIVDAPMIRKLVRKGADIPGIEKTAYIIIKPVTKTKDVEMATTT